MRWDTLEEEQCSLARTVAVIGDRWSLLVLRECFLRIRRFEEFQSRLSITRHLLADRLKKFVRFGVLRRVRYQDRQAIRLLESDKTRSNIGLAIVNGISTPVARDQCMEDTACQVECPVNPKACIVVNTKKKILPRKVPKRDAKFEKKK